MATVSLKIYIPAPQDQPQTRASYMDPRWGVCSEVRAMNDSIEKRECLMDVVLPVPCLRKQQHDKRDWR